MAEEQLFRTAISGFNKDDVIAYIDGINRAATENQEWFDRQSKAMAETIKKLTKENTELRDAAENTADPELEEKLMKANAVIEELNARILAQGENDNSEALEALRQEKETIANNLRQACQRIYDEQKKNEQLTAEIEELKHKLENSGDPAVVAELKAKVASLTAQLEAAKEEVEMASATGLHKQLEAIEAQAAQQIEELTAQNRQLTSRITLLQAQANANAQTARINASGIYSAIGVNSEAEEKYQERIKALEEQARRLEAENEKLRNNADVSKDELQILRDKARLYDDIKNNVAKIVEDARRKAADMIRDAEISSKETLDDGLAVLSQMQRRIRNMQDEIEDARRVYNDASLGMMSMLNSLGDSISITDNHLISILGSQDNK